jgi:hypothetical protein
VTLHIVYLPGRPFQPSESRPRYHTRRHASPICKTKGTRVSFISCHHQPKPYNPEPSLNQTLNMNLISSHQIIISSDLTPASFHASSIIFFVHYGRYFGGGEMLRGRPRSSVETANLTRGLESDPLVSDLPLEDSAR